MIPRSQTARAKQARERYHNDPEFREQANKKRSEYYRLHREQMNEYHRKYRHSKNLEIRTKVIQFFGGKCIYCGCDNPGALEINHKNGGGGKENRNPAFDYRRRYREILNGKREDLELVCRVCNANHYLCSKGITGITVIWTSPIRGSEIIRTELPENDLGSAGGSPTINEPFGVMETQHKTIYQKREC